MPLHVLKIQWIRPKVQLVLRLAFPFAATAARWPLRWCWWGFGMPAFLLTLLFPITTQELSHRGRQFCRLTCRWLLWQWPSPSSELPLANTATFVFVKLPLHIGMDFRRRPTCGFCGLSPPNVLRLRGLQDLWFLLPEIASANHKQVDMFEYITP